MSITNHIGNCPLACIDENGIVINMVDMWEHTEDAYNACVINNPSVEYISICEVSEVEIPIGSKWNGTSFEFPDSIA